MTRAELEGHLRSAAALFASGRLDEAHAIATRLVEVAPGDFHVQHLRSALAARRGDWEECVAAATAALALQPGHAEALANRGAALRMLGRPDAALADYDMALHAAPASADAHNNRGVALAALNRHREAIETYTRAIELRPGYDRARFNRAMSRLVTGDFEQGWADHESRWTGSEMHEGRRALPGRAWDGGEPLAGKRLLLYAEQGLGDAIQFVRYAAMAQREGAHVIVEAHAPLKELLRTVEGVAEVCAFGEPLPAFDLHCALMSLPFAFQTRLDSIPARIPYIRAPQPHRTRWSERLSGLSRPRIGLAWSGSRTLRNDVNRSIALQALEPLARTGLALVAVQKDIREGDRPAVGALGIHDFSAGLSDLRDTAALIEALDLVITVDTSAAHLAGAMGKPAWVMLPFAPDWRWMLDRDDSPWYPTARLFRQPHIRDWDPVVQEVASALAAVRGGSGAV